MTVGDFIQVAQRRLEAAGIGSARLDVLVLVEDQLGHDRAWVLAHPEYELTASDKNVLDEQFGRRVSHEPLAHLRGHSEFYGRKFVVSAAVLQPRPESEAMIEALKKIVSDWPSGVRLMPGAAASKHHGINASAHHTHASKQQDAMMQTQKIQKGLRIADVGAGSGALGITAQLELPEASVDLLEIDEAALAVARANVINHTTGQKVIKSDLLAQSPQDYDILLCNLPYVPDDYQINRAAKFEPRIALFGGPDGLNIFRQLFAQLQIVEKKPLYILIEAFPDQHAAISHLASGESGLGYRVIATDGFIVVLAARPMND
ncbi:MAG: putative Modification methylase, HemK family [Candidatus Saccharibacteria bacterium]|nr:putative Modification methylase, HemK family [Candidatus Saccharibacteria bacterium]